MNVGQQGFPGFLGEVEHDVAQEDDVETVVGAIEGEAGSAEVCLAEAAHGGDFRFEEPVFTTLLEVAGDEASGKSTIDFDAVVSG